MQIINNITNLVKLLLPTKLRQSRFVQLIVSLLYHTSTNITNAYNYFADLFKYMKYTSQIASLNEALYQKYGSHLYYVEDDFQYPTYFGEGITDPTYRQIVGTSTPFIINSVSSIQYRCIVHIPCIRNGVSVQDVDAFVCRYIFCGIRYIIQIDAHYDPNQGTYTPASLVQM